MKKHGADQQLNSKMMPRLHVPLYSVRKGDKSLLEHLKKAMPSVKAEEEGASRQGQDGDSGEKLLPFDFDLVAAFKESNPYHSACIDAKTEALVGLGFVTEKERKDREEKAKMPLAPQGPARPGGIQPPQPAKGINKEDPQAREEERLSKVDKILDPLCDICFQSVLGPVGEDYQQTGNGYIEVVRDDQQKIVGLHHIPASRVRVVIEDDLYRGHYIITTSTGGVAGTYRVFARFGDSENLRGRLSELVGDQRISEVIHFKETSSQNRWYGIPKWLAAVAGIELFQCLHQHEYDFFLNRGVPEFMLFLLGAKLNVDDWSTITDAMEANIGLGNSSKSVVLNLNDRNMKIQLEKLAMDDKGQNGFKDRVDTLSLEIVSAHRVPPLLAGIQIPGKLGAANEIVSAMKAFQTLVIGPQQKIFESTLVNTLGNAAKNGGLGLNPGDFELRKITDEMEVENLDTVSRMRQEFVGPDNQNRDPKEGLKD